MSETSIYLPNPAIHYNKPTKPNQQKFDSFSLYLQSDWFIPRGAPIDYRLLNNASLDISMEVTSTEEQAKLFTPSTRGCIMPDEGLSHPECRMKCQKKIFTDELSCIPWWIKAESPLSCRLSEYNEIIKSRASFDKCYDDCPLHCNTTWYSIDEVREDSTITSITMRQFPLVRYKRKVIFGVLELIVSFGGIMGLFLGYSVLTTVELIYYFTVRPYCGAVIAKEKCVIVPIRVAVESKGKEMEEKDSYPNLYMQ